LSDERRQILTSQIAALFERSGFAFEVNFAPYRVGSAFLHFKRLENHP